MSNVIYAIDRPPRCGGCRYHDRNRNKCFLGRNNCYYIVGIDPEEWSACNECPYRRDEPCIGFCLKKCCEEVLGRRGQKKNKGGKRSASDQAKTGHQ